MRRLEYVPLDDLQPAMRNPKSHALPELGVSVGRFGLIELLVRDERTGRLVSGHGRVEALRARWARGEEPPSGVRVADGAWEVPVVAGWASRDDAEAEALLVALNRLSERGGWEETSLLAFLETLGSAELAGTGFDATSVDDLLAAIEEREAPPLEPVGQDRYGMQVVKSIVLDYSDGRVRPGGHAGQRRPGRPTRRQQRRPVPGAG